jgi:hypothetical protein
MCRFGLEMDLKSFQDVGEFPYIEMAVEFVQEFDETAHVRAFELPWQINVHVYRGHRMLDPVFLVHHSNRIADIFHAHLVDAYIPVISPILDINHKKLVLR